ncbi:hypothetical protein BLNAU_19084 [Blattamonas nauphoetae]|uniref:Uncharacterized protein n=1 Tax=Blattamonas nauphoetae TaxID=2049346 RepID=A0ABQ9X321_9EUKA|nr:hypothetical protein BLNAU_19084 [Blattamonas nauphoetae]
MANCLPLTLLITTLTAAPPSHYLPILNIFIRFWASYDITIIFKEPYLKNLLAIFPPDTSSDDHVITALLTLLSRRITPSYLWKALVEYAVTTNPPSKIALSILSRIWINPQKISPMMVRRYDVPRIARLLFQELDELSLSFVLSVLGQNADLSDEFRFEDDEAQQIVEKLLEIEQRHPLHTDTQETEKTTTDGTPLSPVVARKGKPTSSTTGEQGQRKLVDVWRVMRMAVSSLAGSPSGLERLHVQYPFIFQRLKERGNTLLREGRQAEPKKDELLLALVRVCSELTPLLRTVDCFPLVHLVSSFLHLIRYPPDRTTQQSGRAHSVELPDSYVRMKEFFFRVDEVTHGLDGYDIAHHTIFPPSSTEHSSGGANRAISRPIPLLEFFVDFEVKCIGVGGLAYHLRNTTVPDQTRRQLLLHLLRTMKTLDFFDSTAVAVVLLSFSNLQTDNYPRIHTFMDTFTGRSTLYPETPESNASLPLRAKERCHLLTLLLLRAAPNEADSEEKWRVVLREEGWEDMLCMILKTSLATFAMMNGMNCFDIIFTLPPSRINA